MNLGGATQKRAIYPNEWRKKLDVIKGDCNYIIMLIAKDKIHSYEYSVVFSFVNCIKKTINNK